MNRMRGERWVAAVALALVAIVVAGSLLMVLPRSTPLRSQVAAVASPMYSQNWRLFAPSISKVNTKLEVRGQWRNEEGELVVTGWMPATVIEQRTVSGSLGPSRTQKPTHNAAQEFQRRYRALNDTQRERVRDTFIRNTDGGGFSAIPDDELIAELDGNERRVIRYLRMDYMFTRYATLFTTAALDRDIERVQWRVVVTRANDFAHRFDDAQQFEPRVTLYGWRQSTREVDGHVVEQFRRMIDRNGAADELLRHAQADE